MTRPQAALEENSPKCNVCTIEQAIPVREKQEILGYNAKKAAQTIAYLAMKNGGKPLDVLKAVKLVYLADRESIARYGFPIQDETRVSMPHGPVNSKTYSYIQGEQEQGVADWSAYLQDRENHMLALARDNISVADLDELSEADVGVLDRVWDRFGPMGKWELVRWTHDQANLPEWEDPQGSSAPIPLALIMAYVGVPNVEAQAALVKDFDRIDSLFRAL